MIKDIQWVEKHRPTKLEDVALNEENRNLLKGYLEESEEIPHLLLTGPAGCGKTTIAKIIIDKLDAADLTLNASDERGIDTIRDKVSTFAQGRLGVNWQIVFLDEADNLTRDAQQSLRNLMETHASRTRFILTANYPHKIIDPIESRCVEIQMRETPPRERFRILKDILDQENVPYDDIEVVGSYAKRFTDLRRMIMSAQKSFLSNGKLEPAREMGVTGEQLFEVTKKGEWGRIKRLAKSPNFDHRSALIDMFWAIPDDFPNAASWRAKLGEAVWQLEQTPDEVVHFLGTVSYLIAKHQGN